RAGCSIPSTAPRTSPMACRSSAPRLRSRWTASPRSPPSTIRSAVNFLRPSVAVARSSTGDRCESRQRRRSAAPFLSPGFPYDVHSRIDEIVGLFARFVGRGRAVRRLGSAAIDLCYVAAGRMDGFWERDLKPWDIAGGALIVAEAGGRITNMDGSPFASRGRDVLATNGLLPDAMLEVIDDFRRRPEWRRPEGTA